MRITKKEIREMVLRFKNGTPFDWEINSAYLIICENGSHEFSISYKGQGINSLIYDEEYKQLIDIKSDLDEYIGLGGHENSNTVINNIYNTIINELELE